ncbi:MAG: hypothetical protein IJ545_01335 [Alphaproteobacteria bacterium]|nr:hypothetical protein [Alphaproteobacteria bacterium]
MFNNNNNYNSRNVPSFIAYGGVPVGLPKGAVSQNATGGAVPQWALGQQNSTSPFGQPTQLAQNNTQMSDGNSKTANYSLYGNDFTPEFIDKMLGDTRFQNIMAQRTSQNEGGYANHPNDNGGPTNFGISSHWYPNEDIKNLTPERASALLYRDYWLKPKINLLPDEFADIVFDDGVVQGQHRAIKYLQNALGVEEDGLIGDKTLNALSYANDETKQKFIQNVRQRAQNIAERNPSQKRFVNGWLNRANSY